MKKTNKRFFNLMLSLLIVFAMTAFLFVQISKAEAFAIEDDATEPPAGEEIVATEELVEEEPVVIPNDLAEPEELLDEYIEVITEKYAEKNDAVSFEAKDGIIPNKLRGSRLTGADKKVYDILKAQIEKVAAGNNEEGLTYFTIDFGSIFSEDEMSARYSAEDLNVEEVVAGEYITEEAEDAIMEMYNVDSRAIMRALLNDCPYTLFWFDKTFGMGSTKACEIGAAWVNGEWKAYCTNNSVFKFYFAVSNDYAPDSYQTYDFNGTYRPVQTNTVKIKRLSNAVTNAMAVVSYAANNKSTDYDKLDYYRKWICDEVSYNHAAVNSNQAYGDPWQLIYAFDKDEATNIVCEGYSKAFKYLCDLTDGFDESIDCRLVTGEMTGGTGAGPHMWNLVEIGGANYLVDVTNCDSGTVGAPKKLFMVGNNSASTAQVTDDITGIEATAESYYFDNLNPAMTYTYDVDTVISYDDSERQLSVVNYSYCEHNWGTGTVTKEATCVAQGEKTFTCSKCNATKKEKIDINQDAHKWDGGSVTQTPTCKEAGVMTFTCEYDSTHTRTDSIDVDPNAHKWDGGSVTQAPTCKEEGIRTYSCEHDSTHTKTEDIDVDPNAHDWNDWSQIEAPTCTTKGIERRTCKYVTSHFEERDVDALGHNYQTVEGSAKGASCTEDGKEADKKCSRCQDTIIGEKKAAAGHSETVISEIEATCTESGMTAGKKCSVCGEVLEGLQVVPAKGHREEIIPAVEPTCTAKGSTEGKKCSVCDEILEEAQEIAAIDHSWDQGEVTEEPTTTAEGVRSYTCNRCNTTKTESIPKLPPVKIAVPAGKTLTYNAKAQTGVAGGTGYTLSGTVSATNAGSYTAKATPKDGYAWSDGSTAAKNISWKINKAVAKVGVPAGKTFTYNGKAQTGVAAGSNYTLSGTVKATKAGSYTAKATLKTNANYTYKWSDNTTAAKNVKWTIKKAANPLTIKAKTATVKFTTLKKKTQVLAVGKLITFSKKAQGAVTYVKASGNKGITINKKTGAATVKKGLKKGTYKIKIKATAAGNANYNKITRIVTFTIRVK